MRPSGRGSLWRRSAVPWRLWRLTTGSTTWKCWMGKDMLPHHPDWTNSGRIVVFLRAVRYRQNTCTGRCDSISVSHVILLQISEMHVLT